MRIRMRKKGPPSSRRRTYARAAMRALLIAHARQNHAARDPLAALVAIHGPDELRAAAAGVYLGEGIDLPDVAARFLQRVDAGFFAGYDFAAELAADLASW